MRPSISRAAPFGAALLAMAACSRGPSPDAYGNFETTEVVVSAETSGQLLRFTPTEGGTVPAGAVVAVLDTAQLALERDQVAAQRVASESHVREVGRQVLADHQARAVFNDLEALPDDRRVVAQMQSARDERQRIRQAGQDAELARHVEGAGG